MNKRRLARPPLQAYRNRDYALSELDDRVFDALNTGLDATPLLCTSGCLDELDQLPAGGMEAWGSLPFYDQIEWVRGMSLAELRCHEVTIALTDSNI